MNLPTDEDLQTLTDTELEEIRLRISHELIRREELTAVPAQIAALTQRFVDHGGDPAKLKNPNSYTRGPKK